MTGKHWSLVTTSASVWREAPAVDSARRRRSSSAQAVPWPSCRRVTEISGAGAATRRRRWKTCTEKGEAMGLGTEEPRLGPALPIRRCSTSTSKRRRAPGTIPVQSPKKSSEHWSTGAWAFFFRFLSGWPLPEASGEASRNAEGLTGSDLHAKAHRPSSRKLPGEDEGIKASKATKRFFTLCKERVCSIQGEGPVCCFSG